MKSKTFTDFDAFVSNVRNVDCNMMAHNVTKHYWNIFQVNLSEVELQLGQLGSGNILEGQSWSNGVIIYLPINQRCLYLVNGEFLDKYSFMIFEPGCEFCLSSQGEHDWCAIFIPSHKLIRDSALVESNWDSQKKVSRITPPNYQLAKQFLNAVHSIMNTASHCSNFESSTAAIYATEQLLKLAPLIIGQKQTDKPCLEGRPKFSRREIILGSKSLFEKRHGKPISVKEWATELKVSERTLRNVFNEYFGVSPLRYLQLRQLHQVYRALRVREPRKGAVKDILLQKGVWDFRRFVSRYRQVFGQLPSETRAEKNGIFRTFGDH